MADRSIDLLVGSLASGQLALDQFIDAVEGQVQIPQPINAGKGTEGISHSREA
ncbi:hypothetical protein [Streptomyces sp. NPDC048386]|uniref:hypothetical protein n=1 Tax=Streptomyces sp. NPDC048386 TaxID=3365541 RepID=UPI00371455DF